eukprot:SAG31_NODE_3938_length_3735_cov_3.200220_3_plen_162_part_00
MPRSSRENRVDATISSRSKVQQSKHNAVQPLHSNRSCEGKCAVTPQSKRRERATHRLTGPPSKLSTSRSTFGWADESATKAGLWPSPCQRHCEFGERWIKSRPCPRSTQLIQRSPTSVHVRGSSRRRQPSGKREGVSATDAGTVSKVSLDLRMICPDGKWI